MAKISIKKLTAALQLETLYDGGMEEIEFTTPDINRPGLALTGFFDYFAADRMQIFGQHEMTYLMSVTDGVQRYRAMEALLCHPFPCLVVSRGLELPDGLGQIAIRHQRPLFRTQLHTNRFINLASAYLNRELAPMEQVHGVLVDVYGVGVLLTGDSGVGKSEAALELMRRGHRLVADDVVEVRRIFGALVGTSPESIRHFMEIRGIGIINIRQLYGIGSVLVQKEVDMICRLEHWGVNKEYERLGLEEAKTALLGIDLPLLTIPVVPGRNIAVVIEVAARVRRLKLVGYNAAEDLTHILNAPDFEI